MTLAGLLNRDEAQALSRRQKRECHILSLNASSQKRRSGAASIYRRHFSKKHQARRYAGIAHRGRRRASADEASRFTSRNTPVIFSRFRLLYTRAHTTTDFARRQRIGIHAESARPRRHAPPYFVPARGKYATRQNFSSKQQ